jgi:hypothetical protein
MSANFKGAFDEAIKRSKRAGMPGEPILTPSGQIYEPVGRSKGQFTPEQEKTMKDLYKSFNDALSDPKVPPEQKKAIQNYIDNVLEPVFADPSKFLSIFSYSPKQE